MLRLFFFRIIYMYNLVSMVRSDYNEIRNHFMEGIER